MIDLNGRNRVVISNVSPMVEEGRYPAKSAEGEFVIISADVFSDGHDEIDASVLVQYPDTGEWREHDMDPSFNDRWSYRIKTEKIGKYSFVVQGWVDHYATWRKGLKKKYEAGQDLKVELLIGAELLAQALSKSTSGHKKLLNSWISTLKKTDNTEEAVMLAL